MHPQKCCKTIGQDGIRMLVPHFCVTSHSCSFVKVISKLLQLVQKIHFLGKLYITWLILGLHPANERCRYFVTMSLIGWVQAQNQHCIIPCRKCRYNFSDIAIQCWMSDVWQWILKLFELLIMGSDFWSPIMLLFHWWSNFAVSQFWKVINILVWIPWLEFQCECQPVLNVITHGNVKTFWPSSCWIWFLNFNHGHVVLIINSSPPGLNGCHFADDTLKCIFMNEKFFILIRISLKFVPEGLINSKSALVQVMAWRRTGNKPLPEPMLTLFTDAYMRH